MVGQLHQRAESLVELGVDEVVRPAIDDVLEVVQEHHRAAVGEGLEQGPHLGLGGGLRVSHDRLDTPGPTPPARA